MVISCATSGDGDFLEHMRSWLSNWDTSCELEGYFSSLGCLTSPGPFSVLSYNILSDAYASNDLYNYYPSWALSWPYRKQNLLREIVSYLADTICLQEVQSDHYEEFFAPELDKHGYCGLYKGKTNEVFNGNISTIDGCATFFRRDRFSHVKNMRLNLIRLHSL